MQRTASARFAFPALLAGATGIGFAPIFVRLSEAGPSATAFYRVLLALPFLWLWMRIETRSSTRSASPQTVGPIPSSDPQQSVPNSKKLPPIVLFGLSGFFFAADLACWHWSIQLTSVANSTLLINFAPFLVTFGARFLFGEAITPGLFAGLFVAATGAVMLVGSTVQFTAHNIAGDLLALVTAVFYAAYLLSIKFLRLQYSTGKLMLGSGISSCIFLGTIAWMSGDSFQISNPEGWLVLIGLALISHVGGQSLIAFALAHLPASFSSVSLLLQPVVAASLAAMLLAESLGILQIIGGVVVMTGIAIANARRL